MKNLITQKGSIILNEKLKNLKLNEKPKLITELSVARKFGDLSENSEYQSAKSELYIINEKIENLEKFLSNCQIFEPENIKDKSKINFSAKIKLKNITNNNIIDYQIVGDEEINLFSNSISINSPITKLLIGKSVGETVKFKKLNKIITYQIISINYS